MGMTTLHTFLIINKTGGKKVQIRKTALLDGWGTEMGKRPVIFLN